MKNGKEFITIKNLINFYNILDVVLFLILICLLFNKKEYERIEVKIEPIPINENIEVKNNINFEPHFIHSMEVVTESEIDMGEVEMLAKLIQSEAGNQSYTGRVLVADVVINRMESSDFPNTIEEVINQKNQFSVVKNGMFEKAGKNLNEENIKIATQELATMKRYNDGVLYFGTGKFNGNNFFKEDDHWFSY